MKTAALIAALLVPVGLLHAFLLAEIGIGVADILFVIEMFRTGNFGVWRIPWFVVAVVWWVWLLVCSIPAPVGWGSAGWFAAFPQALVIIRFLVFALALQVWIFAAPSARKMAFVLLGLSCVWIGMEAWQQLLTGRNIFGDPRWGDGALTGPFWKPRAGDLYGHLLFVALPAVAMWLFGRRRVAFTVLGEGLVVAGVVTSVLIGQRMGVVFAILGGAAATVLLPRMRRPVILAVAAGAVVLLATPVISPPTHAKMVGETGRNLGHFAQSPYGELFTRAAVMGLQSPWHGYGYNGFRYFCTAPRFDGGIPALGLAPTQRALAACNLHPHNFYLQAFEESGVPGLALFCLMNIVWLMALFARRNAVGIGLFIGVLTYAWPLASTDDFPTLYEPGWLFFILGLGLAWARQETGSMELLPSRLVE